MIRPFPATMRSQHPCGNCNRRTDEQGNECQHDGCGIMFGDNFQDRLLKSKRLAKVSVQHASNVTPILRHQRQVQPQRVSKLLQIFHPRAFPQHLRHRIARNQMRQHKNHGYDQPQRGNCIQNALADVPKNRHLQRGAFAARAAAGASLATSVFLAASFSAALGVAGLSLPPPRSASAALVSMAAVSTAPVRSGFNFTRETRRRSISITVKRKPSASKLSPPRGMNPSRFNTNPPIVSYDGSSGTTML